MKELHSKQECIDYLWQYSRFYAECLWQGEVLYREERGFSSLTVLFNCLENISRAVTNDYNSKAKTVYKKLYTMNLISEKEHNFLNEGEFCIRKIRNLYAHANVMAINFLFEKDGKENIKIIAKIENKEALNNLEEIIVENIRERKLKDIGIHVGDSVDKAQREHQHEQGTDDISKGRIKIGLQLLFI